MRKEWTEAELLFLEDHIGMYKLSTIANRLNRSYESVRVKMKRLGLSNTKQHTGLVTIGELATILKVDRTTICEWTKKHGLTYLRRTTRESRQFYFIHPTDFWEWASEHKEKVQFSKIEPQTLLPEPDWVAIERQKDKNLIKRRSYQIWTTKEDNTLLELRNQGHTFKEISVKMDRSMNSVARRYERIREDTVIMK
ncbi:DNA-binding CsgD family transcriptional regulator [Cytobacillus eiseniae]|uniref:DNA-binding CsgD family transcriptional regulator n=1 Tax=Cytobacillus eiseniae TaxID=762947 RepID=A0ABS4RH54_9BACI|nr:hypothetical protein [Cytobacillus eiseniae]MBP2242225.1 DNA-binding CsgD family transcriptional regulator [Cytobacillus eiseniae]